MGYLDQDLESGYQKVWLELQALGWNRPVAERVARVDEEWRAVVTERYGCGRIVRLDATVSRSRRSSLVMTFNLGMILERHSGISSGHRELLGERHRLVAAKR